MVSLHNRVFCAFGGLFGAGGIASYAAGAHHSAYYNSIAAILLGNAPILIILALSKTDKLITRLGGVMIIIGALLFSFDMAMRDLVQHKLFSYAAPLGGTIAILGWLLFAIAAFLPTDRDTPLT